ncbi:MAG: hypothetical protein ACE5IW_02755 [bacterium]
MMHKTSLTTYKCYIMVFGILVAAIWPAHARAQIVVVVPATSSIDSLSIKDLQRIFKGQPVKKSDETICQIVEFAPASDAFYKKLYDLDTYSIGKHWLRLIFSGERVLPPKYFSKVNKFLKYLVEHENTIGFLTVEVFNTIKSESIRSVIIEGRSYQDSRYPLRENRKAQKAPE